ncbi:MAG: hypothetical protein JNN26_03380 [Candidatus Obscuribacter sp.]|nr:hypothetical protein [Candidatus Obscuribacter sp.]
MSLEPDKRSTVEESLAMPPLSCETKPAERRFLSLFILCFLGAALILSFSETPLFSYETGRKIRGYFAPFGIRQFWRLFGPDVRTYNFYTLVLIEFADGTIKLRELPRMEKLSVWQRFVHEKERNVFVQTLPGPPNKIFYPSVARYLARANFDRNLPENPPRTISFYFLYQDMPLPLPDKWVYRDNLPLLTRKNLHFVYQVMPSDLVN